MRYLHCNGVSLCYRELEDDDGFAIEHPDAVGHWFVSSILRTGTMRGQASLVLEDLLCLAREEGKRVYLIAHAGANGLTQAQLVDWYARHGFETLHYSTMVWA